MVVTWRAVDPAGVLAWSSVYVVGPEARSFLQSQLTQDVGGLATAPLRSLLLDPDGTVVTACVVSARQEEFELVVPSELAEATVTRLRRFRLRTRCEITEGGEVPGAYRTEGDRLRDQWPGAGEFAAGLGPHALGRRVVESTISFAKGCFTGQELVARLEARGANVPWRLVQVHGPTCDEVDAFLRSCGPAGPSGITSAIRDGGGVLALGFAHRSLLVAALPEGMTMVGPL